MHLSKIKLSGFKSFVDKTSFVFPTNLNAVVGPNGCGKSNIIDAVRWVMGESSAKHLRGEMLSDVIFNGSNGRSPVSMAQVELLFDNSKGKLGGEYAKYNELSIKRTLTRDGDSRYFLNNSRARRKDIKNIFLGTGLGSRSYAVIEQGMISRLIEAKPDEIRSFLEEAAGISKYKERRRETQTRIRQTQENISRLDDIQEQITTQKKQLQSQARAAKRYTTYKEQLSQFKAMEQAFKYRESSQKKETLATQSNLLKEKSEKYNISIHTIDVKLQAQKEQISDCIEKLDQQQGKYYELDSKVIRQQNSIKIIQDDLLRAKNQKINTENSLSKIKNKNTEFAKTKEETRQSLQTINKRLVLTHQDLQQNNILIENNEQELYQKVQKTEQTLQSLQEPQQLLNISTTQIQSHNSQIQNLNNKKNQYNSEQTSLLTKKDDGKSTDIIHDINNTWLQIKNIKEKILPAERKKEQYFAQLQQLQKKLEKNKENLYQTQGKLSSLIALQKKDITQDENKLKENAIDNNIRILSQIKSQIKVEKGYENLIEWVLSDFLLSWHIEDYQNMSDLESLQQYPANYIFKNKKQKIINTENSLLKKTKNASGLEFLLSSIIITDNNEQLWQKYHNLQNNQSVICPSSGLWLGVNFLKILPAKTDKTGILQIEKEYQECIIELKKINNKIQNNEQDIAKNKIKLDDVCNNLNSQKDTLQNLQHDALNLKNKQNQIDLQNSQNKNRISQIKIELKEIQNNIKNSSHIINSATEKQQQAEISIKNLLVDLEQRKQKQAQITELLKKLKHKQQEINNNLNNLKTQKNKLEIKNLQACQQLDYNLQQQKTLSTQQDNSKYEIAKLSKPIDNMQNELQNYLQQKSLQEQDLINTRKIRGQLDNKNREQEQNKLKQESLYKNITEQAQDIDKKIQELNWNNQNYQQQISENDFNLENLLENLQKFDNIQALQRKIVSWGDKIELIGGVNLTADSELEKLNTRAEYLTQQYDDINQALITLEGAIKTLDQTTKKKFKTTFDKVNIGLKELFPLLFGGGEAYLQLIDSDILNTGVSVYARPPGKRISSIHLLSGGEKTLTAIAMVFAFFRLNPAPFCMLDEVDAPLDEANVLRFSNLLTKMAEEIQFIFITHNKRTMEISQFLTGITMAEPGVSRMVAVDMAEAIKVIKK